MWGGGAWVQSMTEEVPHARNKLTNKIAIMSGDKLGKKEFSEPEVRVMVMMH